MRLWVLFARFGIRLARFVFDGEALGDLKKGPRFFAACFANALNAALIVKPNSENRFPALGGNT